MKRRDFIRLAGGAAVAWPMAATAQQPAMPMIGYLSAGTPGAFAPRVHAFSQGLSELGFIEGRNVAIEYRWAGERYDQLSAMAADLVRQKVAVIVADGPAVTAAKAAATTVPIVFWTAGDPVTSGIVASLNRPGGNLTGVTSLGGELTPKRLELLHELVPTAVEIAILFNPTNPFVDDRVERVQVAARMLGLQLNVLHASTDHDIEVVFANLAQRRPTGLVITPDFFLLSRTEQLAALGLRHSLPAIYQYREFTAAGGLMSYGGSVSSFRTVGNYAGRILKGEKPADLPVQQATRIELVLNMKTAKALGITFPITLLGRADEVIE